MISLPGAEDGYLLHPGLPWSISDNSFFFGFRLTLELRFQVEAGSRLACRRGRIAWMLIPGKWWTFGGRREQPRCHGPFSWPHSWALMRHQQHQLSELQRPETLALPSPFYDQRGRALEGEVAATGWESQPLSHCSWGVEINLGPMGQIKWRAQLERHYDLKFEINWDLLFVNCWDAVHGWTLQFCSLGPGISVAGRQCPDALEGVRPLEPSLPFPGDASFLTFKKCNWYLYLLSEQ